MMSLTSANQAVLDAASAHASELARLITLFGRLLRQQRAATQSHEAQGEGLRGRKRWTGTIVIS
jgi:hypothetical protein